MTIISVTWNWINWKPGYSWSKDIFPKLEEVNLTEEQLRHCVYVIRVNGLFAIRYPNGTSPTLYIGQGILKNRLKSHDKEWLSSLTELVGEDFFFQVGVCVPGIEKNIVADRDFEAALLIEFKNIYGCAPLKNAQIPQRLSDYEYIPNSDIRAAIMIGKGVRYLWDISPMKSNAFYDSYWKTHDY